MLSAAVISCKKDKPEVLTANNNTVNTALADEQNASESNKTETSVLASICSCRLDIILMRVYSLSFLEDRLETLVRNRLSLAYCYL